MQNARLVGAHTGIKFARRNINNHRCADDITFMSAGEEELKKNLLIKLKEGSEKDGLKVNI